MARRIQVVIEDDLNGGPADETMSFGLDGVTYEIDLNARNADKLRSCLAPYIEVGRKSAGPKRRSTAATKSTSSSRSAEVRQWAQDNGIAVSARGRVSADVIAKYDAAH